jgi:hypothetical protein
VVGSPGKLAPTGCRGVAQAARPYMTELIPPRRVCSNLPFFRPALGSLCGLARRSGHAISAALRLFKIDRSPVEASVFWVG